jgi:FixJ family two-component response regulator
MTDPTPTVIVVDDDPSFRRSMQRLLRRAGFDLLLYESADQFLDAPRPDAPTCLVLDVRLRGTNGLELQRRLSRSGIHIPIIFITGHGDIPMSVQAMKAGAMEFLTKPFDAQALLKAVSEALRRATSVRHGQKLLAQLHERYESLTRREREVMTRVVAGKLNKQIAGELGTSEKTIKFHRGHMMRKMAVVSVPELVRAAAILGIQH